MSILIRWNMMRYLEGSFEVSERELDVMIAAGVDVRDEYDVADFYQKNIGKEVGGVRFRDTYDLAEDWNGADQSLDEINDWSPEGEAPERFWPEDPE